MFKRTLLVLEPGDHPDTVIQTGLALARSGHSEVVCYTGLSGTRLPTPDMPDSELAAQWGSLEEERLSIDHLHARARQMAEGLGMLSRSIIASAGDPVRSIVDAAQASCCDAIVAACERSNAVVRLLNGSLIPGLVTESPMPVVVCPARPSQVPESGADVCRILVVLEGEGSIEVARSQALGLARELAADLLFVHVTPSGMVPLVDVAGLVFDVDDRLTTELKLQSQRLIASACRLAAKAGLTARGVSLPAGTTAKDIARVAAHRGCGLIVIGHRGGNAVLRLLSGSLIPGLITAAATPVMICQQSEHPPTRGTPRRRLHRHRGAIAATTAP